MSSIILITGSMAAGKSTVAQALAERLPRSVHLRGDMFRRMIVNGRAEMDFALSAEAQTQLQLRHDIAVMVAKRYADAGFTVVYQDIIIGSDLEAVASALQSHKVQVVVLCPQADVLAQRDHERAKTGYSSRATVDAFDHVVRHQTPRIGLWLDTSALTVAETVEAIFVYIGSIPA